MDIEERVKKLEDENRRLSKKVAQMDSAFTKMAALVMSIGKKLMKLNAEIKNYPVNFVKI